MFFYLYQSPKDSQWYWRLIASGNGKTIADGAEGYHNKQDAVDAIKLIKEGAATANIYNSTMDRLE